jgi:general L-amino acid transport system permease protein
MQEHDMSWVRTEMALAQKAPAGVTGVGGWVRKNLVASVGDTILTIVGIALVVMILPQIINWAFINAQWTGPDRTVCATAAQGGIHPDGWSGACWAFVNAKFGQFMFGTYPIGERWRPTLVGVLLVVLLIPMLMPSAPRKGLNALLLIVGLPIVSYFLLVGGAFGLEHVETARWGGLLVTLSLSFVAIVVSLPLGIVLALGRRSKMPVVKLLCIIFIETIRGIPLITVLFMASVMLPLFLPPGVTFDKFLRALIGVSLFAAAYMAEVVRGGLQAIPRGQYEGADSLGLGYWQKMYFIVMPQALKLVIPGIVNTFIGMFKDTSLVSIISMFDLLGIVKQNFSDANWATAQTARSGLVFAAFVFWLFCFGMSRYSMYTERRLDTGHKR